MKSIVSGTEMKRADNYTIQQIGIPSIVLMERAALSTADLICHNENNNCTVLVVSGIGNNGADGLAIARILSLRGYDVCVYIAGDINRAGEEFLTQLKIIKNLNIDIKNDNCIKNNTDIKDSADSICDINNTEDICIKDIFNKDIIVDALFGVGLSRNVEGKYAEIISHINEGRNKVYAVDIPSGIDADTGKICGIAVKADNTVTFGSHKIGTVLYPGADYCGNVSVADIGYPEIVYEKNTEGLAYADKEDLKLIPVRPNYSNKGTFGKALIIAGSRDISGAACLCAAAAFRVGAGMVRVLTAKENAEVIKKLVPEAMVNTYDTDNFDKKVLEACLNWCDVAAVGPGLSTGVIQKQIVDEVLDKKIPVIIDADGINNIAQDERLKKKLHKNIIITPHLGEAARLTCTSVEKIAEDLILNAKSINYKYNVNCILKDARTVIATESKTFVNLTGNSGMATAGSGDVLTGIAVGLLAIGLSLENTAVLAPYIHGIAGDMAAAKISKTGLMASDIINELKEIFK